MYETQFGLNKRPFRALATGSDVFVGPQTASAMAGLKKALASPDAIVAVSGPVGVGKTTIVRRALAAIGKDQVIVSVGRMHLGHDEVLELLLEEMGVDLPSGTVQRFTTFRRLLKQHADAGSRVFIVVEDLSRIGVDALSELEALTASDAGVSEGANIVLMGDENLNDFLQAPPLARLKQRLRLKQKIAPLSASELMGYFKHCFRLAGNEFDTIFEGGAAEVLHRLSDGIPRIANNLVESSLISAVDNKLDRVNVAQIKLVASEEYGLDLVREPQLEEAVAPVAKPEPEPTPVARPQPAPVQESPPILAPEPVATDDDIPELIQDTLPDLEVLSPSLVQPAEMPQVQETPRPEPAKPTAADMPKVDLQAAQVEPPEDEVPEWERDPTLAQLRPDLDALEHAMAVAQGLAPDPEGESPDEQIVKADEAPEPMPEITLDREIQTKVEKAAAALKEEEEKRAEVEARAEEESPIDNRPTAEILAEAKAREQRQKAPDNSVEAQFAAALPASAGSMEIDLNESTDTIADLPVLQDMTTPSFEPAAHATPVAKPAPAAEIVDEALPELKPETACETPLLAEAEAAPELVLETEAVAESEPDPVAAENARKADAELEQIAQNLARARTIDDCDDKMAETLFGEEFSMMAAEVAAMAPPELSANDDIDVAAGELAENAVAEAAPSVADFDDAAAVNVEIESPRNGAESPMDISASQRLATVRALNATAESPAPTATPVITPEPEPTAHPESIEDQINTSMTQTLRALGNTRPPDSGLDDDDEKPKGGFFSRFKRS